MEGYRKSDAMLGLVRVPLDDFGISWSCLTHRPTLMGYTMTQKAWIVWLPVGHLQIVSSQWLSCLEFNFHSANMLMLRLNNC